MSTILKLGPQNHVSSVIIPSLSNCMWRSRKKNVHVDEMVHCTGLNVPLFVGDGVIDTLAKLLKIYEIKFNMIFSFFLWSAARSYFCAWYWRWRWRPSLHTQTWAYSFLSPVNKYVLLSDFIKACYAIRNDTFYF